MCLWDERQIQILTGRVCELTLEYITPLNLLLNSKLIVIWSLAHCTSMLWICGGWAPSMTLVSVPIVTCSSTPPSGMSPGVVTGGCGVDDWYSTSPGGCRVDGRG